MLLWTRQQGHCILPRCRSQHTAREWRRACAMQRVQQSTLGIMPPAITPEDFSSFVLRTSSSLNLVVTSSLSRITPGTSVIRMSFSACRANVLMRDRLLWGVWRCSFSACCEGILAFGSID